VLPVVSWPPPQCAKGRRGVTYQRIAAPPLDKQVQAAAPGRRVSGLEKLNTFHREHETGMAQVMADLLAATGQLPRNAHADEARPLVQEQARISAGRCRGPQLLGNILPIVLARLGVTGVQSHPSGEVASPPPQPAEGTENAYEPIGANPT
jgi:hypothetical protein